MSIQIQLTPVDGEMPLGASYFWDAPQLSSPSLYPITYDEEKKPSALTFIAQFNCAELTPCDKKNQLPQTGFLYFFADIEYFLGFDTDNRNGMGMCQDGIYVLYADVPAELLKRYNPFEEEYTIKPHKATLSIGKTRDDGHKLLGKPFDESVDGHFSKEWQMLFQLDSDENEYFNLQFFDMGMLHFMIETKKLKERDFSSVAGYITSM